MRKSKTKKFEARIKAQNEQVCVGYQKLLDKQFFTLNSMVSKEETDTEVTGLLLPEKTLTYHEMQMVLDLLRVPFNCSHVRGWYKDPLDESFPCVKKYRLVTNLSVKLFKLFKGKLNSKELQGEIYNQEVMKLLNNELFVKYNKLEISTQERLEFKNVPFVLSKSCYYRNETRGPLLEYNTDVSEVYSCDLKEHLWDYTLGPSWIVRETSFSAYKLIPKELFNTYRYRSDDYNEYLDIPEGTSDKVLETATTLHFNGSMDLKEAFETAKLLEE